MSTLTVANMPESMFQKPGGLWHPLDKPIAVYKHVLEHLGSVWVGEAMEGWNRSREWCNGDNGDGEVGGADQS